MVNEEILKIEDFEWGEMEKYSLKDFIVKELFEDRIYHRHFEINENDIVLDIGASVGPLPYTNFHRKAKHFYCLEPSKKFFPSLVKNTRGYPVTTINKAMWEGDGITNKVGDYMVEGVIEMIRFSTLVDLYSLEKVNFLKTDCEGGEYYIFTKSNKEYIKNCVDVIVGEWHLETPKRKTQFRIFTHEFLKDSKFHVYSVDGVDITHNVFTDNFLNYYNQVIIHIDNRKA